MLRAVNPNVVSEDASLTVEYALTRGEILRSFAHNMVASPKLRTKILIYAAAIAIFMYVLQSMMSQSFGAETLIIAVSWGIGFLVFVLLGAFVRGKTSKRTLTVSMRGISTQVGRVSGTVPWAKVSAVSSAPEFILILRTNGNAFFVPTRAFEDPDAKNRFLSQCQEWMQV